MTTAWTLTFVQLSLLYSATLSRECSSACGKNNSIVIGPTKRLRCFSEYVRHTPFSAQTEQTAPTPQEISADWYVTDGKWIALTVKWSQRATDLKSRSVQGYYLKFEDLYIRIKVDISIEDIKNDSKIVVSKDIVNFVFPCVGSSHSLMLRPGEQINIKLHSLPMFRRHDKPQFMRVKVAIPKCEEDERLSRLGDADETCISYWKGHHDAAKTSSPNYTTGRTSIIVHQLYPDHTIYFILAGAIAIFIIIPILLCIVRHSGKASEGHREIAVISNECIFDMRIAHKLVTKFREHYNLNITSNWENQEQIGRHGYHWYQETINRCTMVIFIFEMWSLKPDEIPVEIRQAMQCTEYSPVTTKIEAAILTAKNKQRKKKESSRYKIYEADRNFYELVRRLTGKKIPKTLTMDKLLSRECIPRRVLSVQQSHDLTNCEREDATLKFSLLGGDR